MKIFDLVLLPLLVVVASGQPVQYGFPGQNGYYYPVIQSQNPDHELEFKFAPMETEPPNLSPDYENPLVEDPKPELSNYDKIQQDIQAVFKKPEVVVQEDPTPEVIQDEMDTVFKIDAAPPGQDVPKVQEEVNIPEAEVQDSKIDAPGLQSKSYVDEPEDDLQNAESKYDLHTSKPFHPEVPTNFQEEAKELPVIKEDTYITQHHPTSKPHHQEVQTNSYFHEEVKKPAAVEEEVYMTDDGHGHMKPKFVHKVKHWFYRRYEDLKKAGEKVAEKSRNAWKSTKNYFTRQRHDHYDQHHDHY